MGDIVRIHQMLGEHPFLGELPESVLETLAGCASNCMFAADSIIFRDGQPAQHFYLLRHGTVSLEIRSPGREALLIDTLYDGDVLGWSWLLPPYRWNMDAHAMTVVRALAFDAACLRSKAEADPALGYELYRRFVPVMGRRLMAARMQLADLYARPVKACR